MNRMEEFLLLQQELDCPVPELEHTVTKALRRRRRNRMIAGPLTSIAAVFAVFVALVNFSIPVAMACSKVPVLRELAEYVRFSQSLSQAVEHDYVQTMDLVQSNGIVTAKVEYLIVDQKRLNVYYSLSAPEYPELYTDLKLKLENGEEAPVASVWGQPGQLPDGGLRDAEFTFDHTTMPDTLRLSVKVYGVYRSDATEEDLLGQFEFLLEFDPDYTVQGQVMSVNQTMELNGQFFTVENLEIYPTHIRLNLTENPDNTLWLKDLDFYIQTWDGTQFHDGGGNLSAIGAVDSESNLTYYADSSWFHSAKRMKLIITGAELMEKNVKKIRVDLEAGTAENVPSYMTFEGCEQVEGRWDISFGGQKGSDGALFRMFGLKPFDRGGNACEVERYSYSTNQDTFIETMHLDNYSDTEVWLMPGHTHDWKAETPIEIKVS